MALTASATPLVVDDIAKKLNLKQPILFKKSFTRENLSYLVEKTENKWERMKTIFSKVKGTGLVYVKSRKRTIEIADFLNKNGIKADFYHAGLEARMRTQKQDDWKMGRTPIMVCTNAFGMVIDKPDVRLVLHDQKPDTPEAYYQEAGRAGRDGNRAYCVLLWNESDFLDEKRQLAIKYPSADMIVRVYELLCNYLRIAVGSGAGQSYNFDITEFCNYYKLNPNEVFNCIRILESESYLQSTDSVYLPSRMKILVNYEELYQWQLRHESIDAITKLILRSYGGVFDFYTNIYESELSRRLKKPEKWIKEQLQKLHDIEIIDYIPQNSKPQIIFLENRFSSISISEEKINFLRKRYSEMLEAMNRFVRNQNTCRSKLLVEYFGETNSSDCGHCDICLAKKRNNNPNQAHNARVEFLKTLFKDGRLNMHTFQNNIEPAELDEYLIILRWLVDEGFVIELEEQTWQWKEKRKS
ncbi:MAG: RecQ family ATP-dependent DNA helicase [Bacteroidia bacterium]|nr:RecQ family ATP-dependent DNA helicase [Bacteroidia bacterium]